MIVDLIFVILIFFALLKGIRKGFIGALFSFAALFIGLAAALKLSAVVANYLQKHFNQPGLWWPVLAFIMVFIGVSLLMRLVSGILEKSMEAIALGWVNKIAGFIIFALLYTLIYSVILFYAKELDILTDSSSASSRVYPYIRPYGQWSMEMLGKIIPAFRDLFKDMQHFFEHSGTVINKSA